MTRSIERRLEALERPAGDVIAVWWPGEPQPENWDAAGIQVQFPDHEVSQ